MSHQRADSYLLQRFAALGIASELDDLNRHRKDIEADMKAQAMADLNAMDLQADAAEVGLCLYNPDWHQGVIGILASRVKEQFHRPVIAFADASNEEIKGSARSIPGFHILTMPIQIILLTNDVDAALGIASELDDLNRHRKDIEADMKAQAMADLNAMDLQADAAEVGLCLYNPDWHQGVIGILASRVKEQFHRPVIAFADASNEEIKGSARSIPGFHIRDALDAVAKRYPELLQKFGGHAMAAGLSLKKQDLAAFSAAFNDVATQQLSADALQAELQTDGVLPAADCSLDLAYLLNRAGPWGQGFVLPLFEGEFAITQQRLVGEKHLKLRLVDEKSGQSHEAIAFFIDLEEWPNDAKRLRAVYKLDINRFRGNESLQLMIEYLQPLF